MRATHRSPYFRGMVWIGGIVLALAAAPWLSATAFAATERAHVPGEILIRFQPVGEARIEAFRRDQGLSIAGYNHDLDVYLLRTPPGRTAAELVREYKVDPRVEYVELNYLGEGGFEPDDTFFSSQWHHLNTGQTGGSSDADIDAVEGWDITRGSAAVVVAVLDSGIDSDHPEFKGRILPGFDFVNEDSDPEDDQSHGSLVTGLLAANADNGFAVAGVDHQVKVLPVKVLNQSNSGSVADLADGLTYAANQGAEVISMSLINYGSSSTLINALQYARDQGSILIACAGNGGLGDADVSWPGASPLTISVGATDHDDDRASFSGTGSALDLVAPGELVRTIRYDSAADATTLFSGCSAATPVVAGVATLLLALDPTLTHDDIRQSLTGTAEDQVGPPGEDTPGRDDFFGHGRVNLRDALASLSSTCSPPASGDWVVTVSCTFEGSAAAPANVVVQNDAVLTIASDAVLDIDLAQFHLLVRQGSRVLVRDGGKID